MGKAEGVRVAAPAALQHRHGEPVMREGACGDVRPVEYLLWGRNLRKGRNGPFGAGNRGATRRDRRRRLRVDPTGHHAAQRTPNWGAWAWSRPKRSSKTRSPWGSASGAGPARNATPGPSGCSSGCTGRASRHATGVDAQRRSVAEPSATAATAANSAAAAAATTATSSATAATSSATASAVASDQHAAWPRVWRQEPHPHGPSRTTASSADQSPSPGEGEIGHHDRTRCVTRASAGLWAARRNVVLWPEPLWASVVGVRLAARASSPFE
jgi:hypothetical protein